MKALFFSFLLMGISSLNFAQTYLNPDSSVNARVEDLLLRMTLEEKIGQMTQAERSGVESSDFNDVEDYFLGSVLNGGGSVPSPNTPESWVELYNTIQQKALDTRLGIPILYGVDAVHGHNNLKDAVIFPHNIGLGCTRNPDLVEEVNRITALEVKATGINWTFSPCIAVPQNEFWGRTYEGYGESPGLVDSLTQPAVLGYQTDSLGNENSVLACAKHFVADGGTEHGVDQGNAVITEDELRKIHLKPYYSALEADVGSVMASFSSWNGKKCHGNKYLLTDVLKDEMGFKGFVVSDWQGIDQLNSDFKQAVEEAVNAGVDLAMQPYNYIEFIDHLKALVDEGRISESRIDDAIRRILRVKFQMGLFENPMANLNLIDTIGCKAHKEKARQAVRESLVLLKNEDILPLSKSLDKLLIAGSKATDIGAQCGGWSISWQGRLGNITEGTSIYSGVKDVIDYSQIEYTKDPNNIPSADRALVVVGENPYAEGAGDIYQNANNDFHLSDEDKAMVRAVKEKDIPMVVLLLSGRPLDIREELNKAEAFIAAWLPGTEGGAGIADVLFGDYNPTGKLSHTWPESFDDVPLNVTDNPSDDETLFPYGFGLTYTTTGTDHQNKPVASFKVYPNPARNYLNIRMKRYQKGTLSIIDMTGQIVKKVPLQNKNFIRISMADVSTGMYIVRLEADNQQIEQSLVSVVND